MFTSVYQYSLSLWTCLWTPLKWEHTNNTKLSPRSFLSFSLASNSRIKPLIVHVTMSLNAVDPYHVRCDKVTDVNLSFCLYQLWSHHNKAKDLQKVFSCYLLFFIFSHGFLLKHLFYQDKLMIKSAHLLTNCKLIVIWNYNLPVTYSDLQNKTYSDLWRNSMEVNMGIFGFNSRNIKLTILPKKKKKTC